MDSDSVVKNAKNFSPIRKKSFFLLELQDCRALVMVLTVDRGLSVFQVSDVGQAGSPFYAVYA